MEIDLKKHYELLHDERNSLLYWYPKIADLSTPKTRWLEVDFDIGWVDDGIPRKIVEEMKEIVKKEFRYPVFLRTDHTSGKHSYKHTCFVESEERLGYNMYHLVEDSIMKDLWIRAFVVREFIELDWSFRAFWGELPIAPEVRVMIRDHEIERWFFYWPEDAIVSPDKENWRSLLLTMRGIARKEAKHFLDIAEEVAERFDGYWSVDFARTKKKEWILIDMALGEVSWTPEKIMRRERRRKRVEKTIFDQLLEEDEK